MEGKSVNQQEYLKKANLIIKISEEGLNGFRRRVVDQYDTWADIKFNVDLDEIQRVLKLKEADLKEVFRTEKKKIEAENRELRQEYNQGLIKTKSNYSWGDEDIKFELLRLLKNNSFSEASELLSREILKELKVYTTKEDNKSEIWVYSDGIYIPNGRSQIKELLRKKLGEIYSAWHYNQTIAKVEADTFIDTDEFFKQHQNNKYEIPVMNGILNIRDRRVSDFSSEKIFFHKLPVRYDPKASCPKIEKFLDDVFTNPEDRKVFEEWGGFTLMKDYKYEKALMMVGNGRNGKDKTIELLKRIIGIENCSSIPLASLQADSFQISELFGKLLNIAGDISNQDLKDTSMFKALSGRSVVSGKRKFLRDITFQNYAKFTFACNELPMVYDLSKGFWDRWLLLEFPYTFEDGETLEKAKDKSKLKLRDEDIIDKITTPEELSGLLNKFLEGLDRLEKNKKFSITKGTEEIKNTWIRKSNSFVAFCMDCLEEEPDKKILKKDLRRNYSSYCKKHKVNTKSDVVIKITLGDMFGATDEQSMDQFTKNIERHWVGIKWKEGFYT